MRFTRTLALSATFAAAALAGCAPMGGAHRMQGPGGGPPEGAMGQRMHMDEHMKAMQEHHDKMMRATTQEERNALMAEHQKMMQDFRSKMADMDCMGGRGGDGRKGMGMGGKGMMMDGPGTPPAKP